MAVESENDFRVDLHCVNPGQTTVRLSVEISDHRYQQAQLEALLQDDVTFEVRFRNLLRRRSLGSSRNISFPTKGRNA